MEVENLKREIREFRDDKWTKIIGEETARLKNMLKSVYRFSCEQRGFKGSYKQCPAVLSVLKEFGLKLDDYEELLKYSLERNQLAHNRIFKNGETKEIMENLKKERPIMYGIIEKSVS